VAGCRHVDRQPEVDENLADDDWASVASTYRRRIAVNARRPPRTIA